MTCECWIPPKSQILISSKPSAKLHDTSLSLLERWIAIGIFNIFNIVSMCMASSIPPETHHRFNISIIIINITIDDISLVSLVSLVSMKPIIGPAAKLQDARLFVKASSSWLAWYYHHRNGHHQGRVDHHYHIHHLYLKPIIGPAAKLHEANLFFKASSSSSWLAWSS